MIIRKFITAAVLIAGTSVALAQGGPPAGGPGGGPGMMDPAARFKMLDTNGDGKLSLEEFSAMRMRGGGGPGGPGGPGGAGGPPAGGAGASPPGGGAMAAPADRFKAADKNNDGFLSLEEFTGMMQMMRGRGGPPGGAPPAG